MLTKKLTTLHKQIVSPALFQQRAFSFEVHQVIPPRYFMVRYQYVDNFEDKIEQLSTEKEEHDKMIRDRLKDEVILFKGETSQGQFYVYHGKDELEPHSLIKMDPLVQQGIVKDWEIEEIDFVHKERDDEIQLYQKYA